MDDKEKNLQNEDLSTENDSSADANKVGLEENDNWEFDAKAPTLETEVIDNDEFQIEVPAPQESNKDVVKPKAETASATANSNQITINTKPIKIAIFAIIFAAVVAVLAVLGVRYYTIPNGKEGNMMNPGSVTMTAGDTKVSIGMYNYYYSRIVENYKNYASYGYYDLDTTADYTKQYTTDDEGNKVTWAKLFQQKTIDQIQYITSYYEEGLKNNVALTKEQKNTIKEQISSLESSASESEESVDTYIAATYGEYCTEETIKTMLEQCYIAENYYQQSLVETKVSDDEYNSYFEKNKGNYEKCDFAFIEMTYDTTNDNTKAAAVKKAKEYLKGVKTVDDLVALIPTACDDIIKQYIANGYFENKKDAVKQLSTYVENTMTASDKSYGEETTKWLFNSATKIGATTYYCDETNGYIYLFVKTGKPELDKTETYSVRHILITPGDSTSSSTSTTTKYTDAQWKKAKTDAEALLKKYEAGDKTEYSFAMLAESNSADTESTSSGSSGLFGGYYEGKTKGEMVSEFENWGLDTNRKYGDTAIVKSQYGYHIMYFVASSPKYEYDCRKEILSNKEKSFVNKCTVKLHNSIMKKTTVAKPDTKTTSNDSSSQQSSASTTTPATTTAATQATE